MIMKKLSEDKYFRDALGTVSEHYAMTKSKNGKIHIFDTEDQSHPVVSGAKDKDESNRLLRRYLKTGESQIIV